MSNNGGSAAGAWAMRIVVTVVILGVLNGLSYAFDWGYIFY